MYSAESWEELLLPEIEREQELGKEVVVRADAAFAKPEADEVLEERGVKYAIRIFANDSLERDIAELLTRPVGRPSHKPIVWYKGFLYQAASWKTSRRVVAKVEFHAAELFPRVDFIVTNLELPGRAVVRFYNKRGTAEQWIKEGKQAAKMTRLSCHRFRSNEVRVWLSVLAYNLSNLWWRLFGSMLLRIAALPMPSGLRSRTDSESSAQSPSRAEECQRGGWWRRETDQASQRNCLKSGQGNLRLTPEGGRHMVLRKDKVGIGNSRLNEESITWRIVAEDSS